MTNDIYGIIINVTSRDGAVWKLVGLITRRSQVQILLPQLKKIQAFGSEFFLIKDTNSIIIKGIYDELINLVECIRIWCLETNYFQKIENIVEHTYLMLIHLFEI